MERPSDIAGNLQVALASVGASPSTGQELQYGSGSSVLEPHERLHLLVKD